MSVLGWFLAFVGFVGLIVGLLQMLKGKKMNAVPFRAPSQIAQLGAGAADAKGLVSTEGSVGQQGLLTAPMSGRPCLGYEITVERKWEKQERTENGMQTKKGSSNIHSDYKGGMIAIQDGQGQVFVDASQRPDASFEKSHSSGVNVGIMGIIPSTLQFGSFQMNTPLIVDTEGRTTGFEGIEKIIPPSPTLYALGALAQSPQGPVMHTPKGIGTGKLILSPKGRASLVKSTKRNMVLGYAIGGVMFVGGTLLGIFGPAPDPTAGGSACSSVLTSDVVSCDGRMYEREGYDMKWTVTTAGEYTITAKQPKVKYPIMATLTVMDSSGAELAHDDGGVAGAEAKVTHKFEPGTYTINVRDFLKDKVKGGYGFHLDIARSPDAPAAAASITSADIDDDKAPTPAAKGAKGAAPAAKGVTGAAAKAAAALPAGKPGSGTTAASGTAAKADPKAAGADKADPKAAPAADKADPKAAPAAAGTAAAKPGASGTAGAKAKAGSAPPPAPPEKK